MINVRHQAVVILAAAFVLGCGSGNSTVPARVAGTVKYNGQVVKAGQLTFHTAEGATFGAQLSTDGTYTATDLPVGDMVVTFDTEYLNKDRKIEVTGAKAKKDMDRRKKAMSGGERQPPAGAGVEGSTLYVKVPAKYADKKTSPLKVTLTRGSNTFDVELTD
jgi:hypothetical protein